MVCCRGDAERGLCVTARRSYSLSPLGLLSCFLALALVCWGIAIGFALKGAWLILPFAGMEVAVLAWAFLHVAQHAGDCERIAIRDDALEVERIDGRRVERTQMNRHWTQVVLQPGAHHGACRVALRAHGREVEIGRFVNDSERLELARRLMDGLKKI